MSERRRIVSTTWKTFIILQTAAVVFCLGAVAADNVVSVNGSTGMSVEVERLAKDFMKENKNIRVIVGGSDSTSGIQKMLDRSVDIAMSSRDMTSKELSLATKLKITPKKLTLKYGAVAVIVNPMNSIRMLSPEELYSIFTSKVTNWKELGGSDAPMEVVIGDHPRSGITYFFQQKALKGEPYGKNVKINRSHRLVAQLTASRENAIGLAPLRFATDRRSLKFGMVKVLAIKSSLDAPPVRPSEQTIRNRSYWLAHPLNLFWNGAGVKPAVSKFISFVSEAIK